MGMFDHVVYESLCGKCGKPLSGFQSKDGPCLLETLKPIDVESFHTDCRNCGAWHDYKVEVIPAQVSVTTSVFNSFMEARRCN